MNLAAFKELIAQRCGLTFQDASEAPLVAGLQKRIALTQQKSASAYYERLLQSEEEFHELVCLLTINETFFYREAEQIRLLVDHLIPRVLAQTPAGARVRIFSAGCSTGEEPYSIAIALREKYGTRANDLFFVLGADIDRNALSKARLGEYSKYSFRSLPPELRERYFEPRSKWLWRIKDELRHQVHFHYVNLLAQQYHHDLHDFDIILFRNVSIYFNGPTRLLIQQRLAQLLKPDGCLMIGMAETLANDLGVFHMTQEQGLFYFVRHPKAVQPPPPKPWLAPRPAPAPPSVTPRPVAPARVASAKHTPMPTARTSFSAEEVQKLVHDKRYEQALAVLASWLEQQPDSGPAQLLKAQILLHQKDWAQAQGLALRVLERQAWSIDALVLLGFCARLSQEPESALKWFKQAAYACNECWPAHYYLAELYRARGESVKARQAYRTTFKLLSSSPVAGDGLAVIALDLPLVEVRFLCQHQIEKLAAHETSVRI